jgi:hypothetical protein
VVLGVGCGSDEADDPTGATATTPVVETTDAPAALIEVADIHTGVEYYGACGNETVVVEGTTFYPLLPDDLDDLDETRYPLEMVDPGQSGLMRVVQPGPGDDVGTMIVYADGTARFQSDSGRVVWLTDQEQQYDWVC